MKTIGKLILAILLVSFVTVACDNINSIIQDDLDKGETIYPGMPLSPSYENTKYHVHPGIGRVWLYWALQSDTRVDKTVISYTFNGETYSLEKAVGESANAIYYDGYRVDSLEIRNLAEGYYSFSVQTVDKDGNRSITNALYPPTVQVYGDIYLNTLQPRSVEKMEMLTGGDLQITWSKSTAETLVRYTLVEYSNHSEIPGGIKQVDSVFNESTETVLKGFKRFKTFSIKSYREVGIDVAPIEDIYFPPVVEKALLETRPNTFTELTEEKANAIEELTYPLGISGWTLQDLYYFPNLKTLNLTPGTETLPAFSYQKEYIDKVKAADSDVDDTIRYASTVGNSPWIHFVSGYMPDNDIAIIADLLESGQLTKVKYTRNSYPKLDAILDQYPGKVDWFPTEPLPEYGIMIPTSLLVDYRIVSRDNGVRITNRNSFEHSENGSNVPAAIAAKFDGTNGLNNVYKVVIRSRKDDSDGGNDATSDDTGKKGRNMIAFAIPTGLQFGYVPNGHLKFDCYIDIQDDEYKWLKPGSISKYAPWATIKFFNSRKLPDAPEDPNLFTAADYPFGAERDRHGSGTLESMLRKDTRYSFDDTELGEWKSFDVTSNDDGGNMINGMENGHYRVLRIQLGPDDGTPWGLPSTLTYYIANLRWAK
jgi:hypothetical protein